MENNQNAPLIPYSLYEYREYIEKTLRPIVKIRTVKTKEPLSVQTSKLGGMPYWPNNLPLPTVNNKPAKLVAQINFSDLTEQGYSLAHYPTEGILQFFCEQDDDMQGLEFFTAAQMIDPQFDCTKSKNIKVIYHKDFSIEPSMDQKLFETSKDNNSMPFSYECKLEFFHSFEYLSLSDQYYVNQFYPFASENSHGNDELTDEQTDAFYEQLHNSGSKIGGYAYFTQDDPRAYGILNQPSPFKPDDQWLLLLQIDTDENVMWGDSGVANWFIKKEDLINKNFNNIFFSWDCC